MMSRILSQYLELLQISGVNELFCQVNPNSDSSSVEGETELDSDVLTRREGELASCTKCSLHRNRINIVYGSGNPNARMIVIGEAPGSDENKQGKPFVGRAGQLLTKMLQAINIEREDIYIANIVKCQPPENRNPLPDEISACLPFLKEQIKTIKPVVLVLLGKVAASTLFQTNQPMSELRMGVYNYEGIETYITYHPAALIYNQSLKKYAWEDLQKIQKVYENQR